jgi:hypothetical protein
VQKPTFHYLDEILITGCLTLTVIFIFLMVYRSSNFSPSATNNSYSYALIVGGAGSLLGFFAAIRNHPKTHRAAIAALSFNGTVVYIAFLLHSFAGVHFLTF